MRTKIPPLLFFLSVYGLSFLSLAGAFALSWFGKDSSNSFLVASSFFATVATSSMRNSKILALARLIRT